jgi:hypothetical protein
LMTVVFVALRTLPSLAHDRGTYHTLYSGYRRQSTTSE